VIIAVLLRELFWRELCRCYPAAARPFALPALTRYHRRANSCNRGPAGLLIRPYGRRGRVGLDTLLSALADAILTLLPGAFCPARNCCCARCVAPKFCL
jgi:hypothetical protein